MIGIFVGVFEIIKKERNESKKERKIEEIAWFAVSQCRRRYQKNVKQRETWPRNDFKSYENYYFSIA